MAMFVVPKTCPSCGASDPSLESLEVMDAYLRVESNDAGEVVGFGSWESDPESMTSMEYRWACCSEPLSEDDQFTLDEVLMNERREVVFGERVQRTS